MRMVCSRRLWAILCGFVLPLLLLPLPGFWATAAEVGGKPEKNEVIVPYLQPSALFAPIWTAYEAGLFKKYGLNARVELLNPQVNIQSVVSGDVDFLIAGPDLINARLQGARLKYVGGTTWQHLFQIWGAKEINDVKDLRGKIVAGTTPRSSVDTATRET